jgi:hypothetical protein
MYYIYMCMCVCVCVCVCVTSISHPISCRQQKSFHNCLLSCLRNKSDMVIYEAARTICSLETAPEKLINGAISGRYHSSPSSVHRRCTAAAAAAVVLMYVAH